MTLISPYAGPGNGPQRKGHSAAEPFPPFTNLVGMEIERAGGNFTINQSRASLPQKAKGSRQPNDKSPSLSLSLSSQGWNYCRGCDVRSEREHPPPSLSPTSLPPPMGYLHIHKLIMRRSGTMMERENNDDDNSIPATGRFSLKVPHSGKKKKKFI